jgi:hypothetical protein
MKIETGVEVLRQTAAKSDVKDWPLEKLRAIPVVFLIDPRTKSAQFVKLEKLFDRENDHSVISGDKLIKVLRGPEIKKPGAVTPGSLDESNY